MSDPQWRPSATQELRNPENGNLMAEVFANGVWWTWDAEGVGGENATASSTDEAKREAVEALVRQEQDPIKGWHPHYGAEGVDQLRRLLS